MFISLHITSMGDILGLEQRIRALLRCQTAACPLLQTAPYQAMKHSLLLRLNNVLTHDEDMLVFLPDTQLVLHMTQNASVVHIREASTVVVEDKDYDTWAGCDDHNTTAMMAAVDDDTLLHTNNISSDATTTTATRASGIKRKRQSATAAAASLSSSSTVKNIQVLENRLLYGLTKTQQ